MFKQPKWSENNNFQITGFASFSVAINSWKSGGRRVNTPVLGAQVFA